MRGPGGVDKALSFLLGGPLSKNIMSWIPWWQQGPCLFSWHPLPNPDRKQAQISLSSEWMSSEFRTFTLLPTWRKNVRGAGLTQEWHSSADRQPKRCLGRSCAQWLGVFCPISLLPKLTWWDQARNYVGHHSEYECHLQRGFLPAT